MRYILWFFITLILLGGCSAKEINDTTDSITNDIVNAFENSKDKSN